ncbi:hypothetical protein Hsero_0032 [Herbaspirillum seropedicae SmR1]|uniref:Uncharacterized protein n=1 Tax=Herbaspirillum seropedicae (strain SmR1) TaxID=757424 RepID=D8ITS1_HERSS|nr:hypothetical protein Hsero_0032 [Herbaspirillum seropedicae SmR1]
MLHLAQPGFLQRNIVRNTHRCDHIFYNRRQETTHRQQLPDRYRADPARYAATMLRATHGERHGTVFQEQATQDFPGRPRGLAVDVPDGHRPVHRHADVPVGSRLERADPALSPAGAGLGHAGRRPQGKAGRRASPAPGRPPPGSLTTPPGPVRPR